MEIVHRAFRRESRLLTELVAAVAPGDTARAKVIADHFRDYRLGLNNHHEGEDELLWPPLLSRVDLEADIVLRMEAQHERVAATLTSWTPRSRRGRRPPEPTSATPSWPPSPITGRSCSSTSTTRRTALLPLAAEHITEKEWASLGDHMVASTPKLTLLTLFGLVLEDATPAERATLLSVLPAPVRGIWHVIGRPRYARHIRRVRAA